MSLKASVETPNSKDDRSDVRMEEIPLPPPEMWAQLDNSDAAGAKPEASGESLAPAPGRARQIETLQFKGNSTKTTITLQFPFDHPVLGEVLSIGVRRLTVGEVANILDARDPAEPDNFDIYEQMTGVPAPVLRGLISVDGEAVTEVCFDFLPRVFGGRAASSST